MIKIINKLNFERSFGQNNNTAKLVHKYSNFYETHRQDTLAELQKLPELKNSEELQSKILFSICVVNSTELVEKFK